MSKKQEKQIESLKAELSSMAIKYAQALREIVAHEDRARQRHLAGAVIDHTQSVDDAFQQMYEYVRGIVHEGKEGIQYRGSRVDQKITLLIDISEAR